MLRNDDDSSKVIWKLWVALRNVKLLKQRSLDSRKLVNLLIIQAMFSHSYIYYLNIVVVDHIIRFHRAFVVSISIGCSLESIWQMWLLSISYISTAWRGQTMPPLDVSSASKILYGLSKAFPSEFIVLPLKKKAAKVNKSLAIRNSILHTYYPKGHPGKVLGTLGRLSRHRQLHAAPSSLYL